jgi:hypothetical protein
VHRELIDQIRGGTALFAYYPDAQWLASSQFLRCDAASARMASAPTAHRASFPAAAASPIAPVMMLIGR